MKLIVDKALFTEATNLLAKVINPKNPLPILGDILFDVRDNRLTMTSSDSEITMSTTIGLDTMEGDGRFCVPASDLRAALVELSDKTLTILATTESDMRFVLQHQGGETYFPIDDADNYPLPMQEDLSESVEIDGAYIKEALKRSLWSTAQDDLRPIMSGVHFALKDYYLDVVTSDGHSLVRSRINVSEEVQMLDEFRITLPKKGASLLAGILSYSKMELSYNDTTCLVNFDNYTLTMRLVEGKYPNYHSIIPEFQPLMATAPRAFTLCSLKKVLPFSDDSSRMIRMSLTKESMTLSTTNEPAAKGSYDTFRVQYASIDITVGLAGPRLESILSKLSGSEVNIGLNDERHAVVFTPTTQDEKCQVLMLTMPMLLTETD